VTRRHVVLLDLDGTLIDSAPGIIAGVRAAFEAVDIAPPDEAVMRAWIGPPVRETLQRELAPRGTALVERANAAFRQYFDTVGAHESRVFPGISTALESIAQAGALMSIVTHKPFPLAEVAIGQHGLDVYIEGIHAPPSPQLAVPKEHLFAEALAAVRPTTVISVGDRGSDIRAAAVHGVPGVGVAWGYGEPDELTGAGAVAVVGSPVELPAFVTPPQGRLRPPT